ncbi:MAG: transporter [Rhodobacteraceae bacterium]|nr:transporter [Paracoccaceae bacterium]
MTFNLTNSSMHKFLSNKHDIKGVMVISHGMSEHIGRYNWLISKLNNDGFHVIACDHRGHGNNIKNGKIAGYFANKNGWSKVTNDLREVINFSKSQYPELHCYLLAHSMGSWIALSMFDQKVDIRAMVLTGSSKIPNLLIYFQEIIINIEILLNGNEGVSKLIDNLTIRSFNNKFKPIKSPNDWISSDESNVNNYTSDPLCGFMVTNKLWLDLCHGLKRIFNIKFYSKLNENLPVFIISGECDAASSNGKLATKLFKFLSNHFNNIKIELIPNTRHEIFSEHNKEYSYKKFISFIYQA